MARPSRSSRPTESASQGQDPWLAFLRVARPRLDIEALGSFLCLDPGETTGYARFEGGCLTEAGQVQTLTPGEMFTAIQDLSARALFPRIVYEEYRVRGDKFKTHVGSEVVTIQNIGAIKVVAEMMDLRLTKQTPAMAKGFVKDDKLRRWGMYLPGHRHANDAIRHGVYYILFGKHHANEATQEA